MSRPVIVEAVRTPIGSATASCRGSTPELLGAAQVALLERAGVEPGQVEQVVGAVSPRQVNRPPRHSHRLAGQGLPFEVAATTVDCQCGSSQQANNFINNLIAPMPSMSASPAASRP